MKLDVATDNNQDNSLSALFGTGDGTFQRQIVHTVQHNPSSVTVCDFNSDSKLDLAVPNGISIIIFFELMFVTYFVIYFQMATRDFYKMKSAT